MSGAAILIVVVLALVVVVGVSMNKKEDTVAPPPFEPPAKNDKDDEEDKDDDEEEGGSVQNGAASSAASGASNNESTSTTTTATDTTAATKAAANKAAANKAAANKAAANKAAANKAAANKAAANAKVANLLAQFTLTTNAAISGHNDKQVLGTLNECLQACIDDPNCKAVDWYKNQNKCDLSYAAPIVTGLKKDYPNNPYDNYALTARNLTTHTAVDIINYGDTFRLENQYHAAGFMAVFGSDPTCSAYNVMTVTSAGIGSGNSDWKCIGGSGPVNYGSTISIENQYTVAKHKLGVCGNIEGTCRHNVVAGRSPHVPSETWVLSGGSGPLKSGDIIKLKSVYSDNFLSTCGQGTGGTSLYNVTVRSDNHATATKWKITKL